jgi:hypothetical protein
MSHGFFNRVFASASSAAARLTLTAVAFPFVLGAQSAEGGRAAAQSAGDHSSPRPSVTAASISEGTVKIDGRLDDAAWAAAVPAVQFTQFDPDEGQPPRQRTEVRFLYDDEAIYIGARMYDSLGARGVASLLTRRDQAITGGTDWFHVIFDTFHDHLGRTFFEINPSGARNDALALGNSGADYSWDPVWQAATSIDAEGWTAEMRIPFSQLRFPRDSIQTWGLQIRRYTNRHNESDMWAWWGKKDPGGPAFFGHLEGIRVPQRARQLELLPYLAQRARYISPGRADDPFNDGSRHDLRVGGDLKYRLTSNLVLSATFNPDFGQVEVDPAVVNLSQFETSFPERRPFFVEGAGIFSYGGFNCYFCSNVSTLSASYSRRIGRTPQGSYTYRGGDFFDVPDATTILGAAKVTGRTAKGYSIGLMNAVTRSEFATVRDISTGAPSDIEIEVEPFTNYFVGRIKKDMRGGSLVVGGIGTSVIRSLGDSALSQRLNTHAEQLGGDFQLYMKQRRYSLVGNLLFTSIAGSPAAILRSQRAPARYFQRPDRQHGSNGLFSDAYDPSATSMRGFGLYSRAAKESGSWLWESHLNIRSPGFENNDIAFLTRADFIYQNANILRVWTKPNLWYRRADVIFGAQHAYNFDGDRTDGQVHLWAGNQLKNYWWMSGFVIHRPVSYDDRLTRGGPVVKRTGYNFSSLFVETDSRKRISYGGGWEYGQTIGGSGYTMSQFGNLRMRPATNITVSLGPRFSRDLGNVQYVDVFDDATNTAFYGRRYLFADVKQKSMSMDTRVNWTLSPTMTFEMFMQPLIASGEYSSFKQYAAPRTLDLQVYGQDVGTISETGSGSSRRFTIDPDGAGPAPSFTTRSNPDFNFRSLRGNAVLRWEYMPGSTLFLVWTQNRSHVAPFGNFDFTRDRSALFDANPDNVFLVKVNYWLGL